MRRIKDLGTYIVISLICVCIVGGSALAEEGEYNRRGRIASKGVINYDDNTVVLDSSDLTYLADEIDELEWAYKSSTMEALNRIHTFYVSTDGDISHEQQDNHVSSDMAAQLSFGDLYQGIVKSQSVDHLSNVQAEDADGNPLYYADQNAGESNDLITVTKEANDYPLFIHPADADNLTAGTAAWVDGNLIIGTGSDNAAYYDNGKNTGYSNGYDEGNQVQSIQIRGITTEADYVSNIGFEILNNKGEWVRYYFIGAGGGSVLRGYNANVTGTKMTIDLNSSGP